MPRQEWYVGDLMLKMVTRQTGEISKVNFEPQKQNFPDKPVEETALDRATPESQGVSSDLLRDLFEEIQSTPGTEVHRIMMLRNGKVIGETSYAPYRMDLWHVTYSMCKSITGMAIGILIDEGKLSLTDRISDLFAGHRSLFSLSGIRQRDITVYNLLTMTSGVQFNESGAISGNDWVKGYLEAGVSFAPGTQFEYNSMNTYMLSAIVTEITGMSLYDFVRERIFEPMGIYRTFWEHCPKGITKGGWGLFMRLEDMAKLGQLYLQHGQWNGQQLVPADWVEESTKAHMDTGIEGSEQYGYQLWINKDRPGAFTFNGMLGQNVYILPDVNMVMAINAGNGEIFQQGPLTTLLSNFMKNLTVEEVLPDNPEALSRLKATCNRLRGRDADLPIISNGGWHKNSSNDPLVKSSKRSLGRRPIKSRANAPTFSAYRRLSDQFLQIWKNTIDGAEYDLDIKGIGTFPLMIQVIHNNFTDGISKVGFHKGKNNALFIDLYEGDEVISLKCSFNGDRSISDLTIHGETYRVSNQSVATTDEYGRLVLRNRICFLEEAASRTINFYFDLSSYKEEISVNSYLHPTAPQSVEIRIDEAPGADMIMTSLQQVAFEGGMEKMLMDYLGKVGAVDVIDETVRATIQPVLHGKLITEAPVAENPEQV